MIGLKSLGLVTRVGDEDLAAFKATMPALKFTTSTRWEGGVPGEGPAEGSPHRLAPIPPPPPAPPPPY